MIIFASVLLALHIFACKNSGTDNVADEKTQRWEQLYQKHSLDAQQHLDILLSEQKDTLYADRMARRYYHEGGKWCWMGSPTQLELCDALDSLLRSQVPAMGFKDGIFALGNYDKQLADMHQPDSVADMAIAMAQVECCLTQAYLRYAIGQRFGFTTPSKLFGKQQYDIEIEQADSAFVADAMKQLKDKHTMLNFLNCAEPQDAAYQQLKQQLQKDSTAEARNRTLCNMERLRWRDSKHANEASRYIFVNIASQQVWAIAPDSVINMRICCGKVATKTPLLSSAIHRIEVNPEWGVPQSIIRNEMSGHAGDSAYFARRNYYVVGSGGQRVNPAHLSSADLRSGRYAVRQRSGAGNSLGRIIFRFPNKFSVYLHDTSSPSAFNRESRTVSHGCVRLQRPFDIAEFVLHDADPWLLDKMRLSMDLQPKTEQGKQYKKQHSGAIRLVNNTPVEPTVPVLIDYYTCYPNPQTGKMDIWGDPYGYDKILLKAIRPFVK